MLTPVLFGLLGAWACSPSTGAGDKSGDGVGSGNGGAPGSGGGSGPIGFGGSDDPGVITVGTNSGGTASGLPDGGCFATASKAEQVVTTVEVPVTVTVDKPVDMFIMYDQSGSMNDNTPAGTKWDAIKAALTGFVNSSTSAGIGVGIAYFPTSPPPCNTASATCLCIPFVNICAPLGGGSCTPADYAIPDVAIELLPTVAPKIVTSVNAHNPGGGTPTTPALQGAQQYALGWAAAHPDRKTIVVLATDGDPSGCPGNAVQDVANVASSAFNNALSVQTFVIGVGSSLTSLDAIAAAGGTGKALIVDAATGDPTQQFLDAMNKIREAVTVTHTETHTETHSTAVPCEWTIPAAPDNQKFDKEKVNVDFASGGGAASRIGSIPSAADCANVAQGWHYDDPANPSKVLVCPQTCTMIQSAADAQVNVIFGCATEIAIIH